MSKVVNNEFTFHYVSIKSLSKTKADTGNFYLHSTMYLLNRMIQTNSLNDTRIYIPLCIY